MKNYRSLEVECRHHWSLTLLKLGIFLHIWMKKNCRTVDYDAHTNWKLVNSINLVFESRAIQELNTIHHICKLELLTSFTMSVQNPQLYSQFLSGNRSDFFYVEGSTASLYDRPHFVSV